MKAIKKETQNKCVVTKDKELDAISQKGLPTYLLGACTQQEFSSYLGKIELGTIIDKLEGEVDKIKKGSLESIEKLLITQAFTLDTMFNSLAFKATGNEWIQKYDPLMRLALKAQSQCRATLETLANIKNPPQVAFVKQANIGHNQQVNNNALHCADSRTEETKNQQTQLLENEHDKRERLDLGQKSSTITVDKELATVA
jgi:hypothetical protein